MKATKTYSDSKQTVWETWFIISLMLVVFTFVLGLNFGPKELPSFPLIGVLANINLIYCIVVGSRKRN
jgi:uncharacterized membrane protein